MTTFETPNYIFHFQENSYAEHDILKIAKLQQSCYNHICKVLKTTPDFKIEYFLCETPDEVGRIYGDNEPCNGFTSLPNKIYAVYNKDVQCIGFHEDAHIISYFINRPDCPAIREGLAMYFDRKWWGIQNLDWTSFFIKTNKFIPIYKLLDKETFFSSDCGFTYPIMGAFTDWLISVYGIDKYLELYKYQNPVNALESIYKSPPNELNQLFVDYVKLFEIDQALEQRMSDLMTEVSQ